MKRIAALGLFVAVLAPVPVGAASDAGSPPTSSPAESTGQLNIVSQPGVEVVWEGVPLGTTDTAGLLVIEGIPRGSYGLVLRKAGYQDLASRVDVTETSQSVRMQLRRSPAPARRSEPLLEPESKPTPEAATSTAGPTAMSTETPIDRTAKPVPSGPADPGGTTDAAQASGPQTAAPVSPTVDSMSVDSATEDRAIAGTADALETANTTASELESQTSSLPPIVYLIGLALLGTTGALAVQHRRRVRARAAFLTDTERPVLELPRDFGEEQPSFLGDIRRREVAMEGLLGTGFKRVQRDHLTGVDDIDVEVIDLGPVED